MQLPDIFGVRKLTAQVESLQTELQQKAFNQSIATQFTNFNTQIFPHYNIIKEELIYQTMDDIYSVVSRLASISAAIPFKAVKQDGSELPQKDNLNAFLSTLSFDEKEKFYTTLILMGEVFAYKETISYGVNAGKTTIEYLLPQNMVVIISQNFPTKIVGFRYYDSFNGYTKDFDVEEIFFVKTFNPTSDIQKRFRGLGLYSVLKSRLTRVQSNLDVSIAQMQNGGVPGVMYEKTPLEPGALGKRQDNFARFLNNSSNKGAPYMLNGDVGYFSIGSALADMGLAELESIDFDKICNAVSVSSILFNSKDASTHSNVSEMRKDMFTNAVLPNVIRMTEGFTKQIAPTAKSAGKVVPDVSDIKELQADKKVTADAFAAAPVMRPNDVIEAMGGERVNGDELLDKWYIKSGYTPIEDMGPPPDLVNTAGDYEDPAQAAIDAAAKKILSHEVQ